MEEGRMEFFVTWDIRVNRICSKKAMLRNRTPQLRDRTVFPAITLRFKSEVLNILNIFDLNTTLIRGVS